MRGSASRVRWFGRRETRGPWQRLAADSRGEYGELAACLLLADRNGAAIARADRVVRKLVGEIAPSLPGGVSARPTSAAEAQRAEALDRLCAELDVQIGLTVRQGAAGDHRRHAAARRRRGGRLPARRRRPLRVGAGRHRRRAVHAAEHDATSRSPPTRCAPARPPGVVFLLDVPRVADPPRAFDQMKLAAKRMAHTVGGELVDDNRRPLDDAGARRDPRAGRRGRRRRCARQHRAGQPAGAGALRRLSMTATRRTTTSRVRAAAAAKRAAELRARRSPSTTTRYYVARRADDLATPNTTRCSASSQTLEAAHPDLRHAGLADAARRRRAASRRSTPVTHRVPMLSLRNETDTTPRAPQTFDARVRRELELAAMRPPSRIRLRARSSTASRSACATRTARFVVGGDARRRRRRART